MLRRQSLIPILEKHGYLRKSLGGLQVDMSETYNKMVSFYEDVQAYEMLDLLINQQSELDEHYMIWVKTGQLPHILETKDQYSQVEYGLYSQRFNIPIQEFEEIISAVSS